MNVAAVMMDFVSIGMELATLVVTGAGLWFVGASLKQSGQLQRLETGPYIRVDLGSFDCEMDFQPPPAHYHSTDWIVGQTGESDRITISAWFRNYQTHSLGVALGVRASFLIEIDGLDPLINEVEIPYLELGKTVVIDLLECGLFDSCRVMLLELSFHDFYDRRHSHEYGQSGTNGLHGRLSTVYENRRIVSEAEGRSRGTGVDFGYD